MFVFLSATIRVYPCYPWFFFCPPRNPPRVSVPGNNIRVNLCYSWFFFCPPRNPFPRFRPRKQYLCKFVLSVFKNKTTNYTNLTNKMLKHNWLIQSKIRVIRDIRVRKKCPPSHPRYPCYPWFNIKRFTLITPNTFMNHGSLESLEFRLRG